MQIRVLGPIELELEGSDVELGPPKQRALLALLALDASTTVTVDALVDGLWGGEEPPATAHKMVQLYVSQLRKLLGDEQIVTRGRAYELRVDPDAVDAARFERLVARATGDADPAEAAEAARAALALWRGPALADVIGDPFAAAHARRLDELKLTATEVAMAADLEAGRHGEVAGRLEALVAEHPMRERLHALRMLALYRAGRQAEALEAYRSAREALVEQTGLEPGAELRHLQDAILRQDPELESAVPGPGWARRRTAEQVARAADATAQRRGELHDDEAELASRLEELQDLRHEPAAASPGRGVCPFKGLTPFEEADAAYFFGRERLVAELIARLVGARLLGLVGPSGSGKSSALRAGLLPALGDGALPGSERWRRVLLRPGDRPLEALRHALGAPPDAADPFAGAVGELEAGARLVVAVDQFEEAFTACPRPQDRRAFVDALVDGCERPDGRVVVVMAVRADYYGACAAHPRLARLLGHGHVLVGPMQPDELRRAIEGPARRAGLAVEPALAERLVADVAGTPGALPLLSTALLELWQRRDGSRLRLADYERAGGVDGAVARLAEDAFGRLTAEEQDVARRILVRLAGPGDGETAVRRRVPLDELDAQPGGTTRPVLETLAAGRLITLDHDAAEVTHEALLREWPRLRGWLEDDADGRRLHRRLALDAREWERGGRDAGELYRGARLAAALEWAEGPTGDLNRREREFLEQARLVARTEADRARRANRRLRALLAGAIAALALAVGAGLVAIHQRGDARDTALLADAQRLGAEAQADEGIDHALLLARAGVDLVDSVATRGNLLSVLLRTPPAALGVLHVAKADAPIFGIAVSPDDRMLAMGDEAGTVTAYATATRRRLGVHRFVPVGQGVVWAVAFSPDARTLAVAGVDFDEGASTLVDLLDARTMQRRRRIALPAEPGGGPVAAEIAFLPGGRELVISQQDSDIPEAGTPTAPTVLQRIDARTGERVGRAVRVGRHSGLMVAARDGRRLFVSVPRDDETYELDAGSLRVLRRYPAGGVAAAAGPGGRLLALGAQDGIVRLLDLRSGSLRRLGRHRAAVRRLAFTPDGRTLASTDADGGVRTWDVARGRELERLSAHHGEVRGLDVSPDGRTLYTGGEDGLVVIWDLAGPRRLLRTFAIGRPFPDIRTPRGIDVSPDGRTLAYTHADGSVALVDTNTLRQRATVRSLRGLAAAVAFSRDGRLLAVAGEGGELRLHDARTLAPAGALRGLNGVIQAVAFSPDGRLLAAGDLNTPEPLLGLWDVRTRRLRSIPLPEGVTSLAFSPNGRLLAGAAGDHGTEIRDGRSGRLLRRLPEPGGLSRSVAFSPDGRLLAVGRFDGEARIYSTATWRAVGRSLPGPTQRVTFMAFSHDGRAVMTTSSDGTARLWDVASRRPLGRPIVVQPNAFVSAALSPDGAYLFGVPLAGRGLRLRTDVEAWERHACLVAGRELSPAEWRDLLPHRSYRRVCGR